MSFIPIWGLFAYFVRGTLVSEVNFTGRRNPRQKCLRGRFVNLVKFTFQVDPLQNAFRATLSFEVNFTSWRYPCQKYLRGRFDELVKFTFRVAPLQKGFWGRLAFEVERLCVHLRALPPLQCLLRHIAVRGEFHRSGLPLSKVLQRPIGRSREIHLSSRPPFFPRNADFSDILAVPGRGRNS